MKRVFAGLLTALLLLTSCGGEQEVPAAEQEQLQIEDVCSNAVKFGNSLAAEQGDWVALRGEHEGKVGLMLYNKNDETASFLTEGDVCEIGLLDHKIYYRLMEENLLYCYDIKAQKSSILLQDCVFYQVREQQVYYLTAAHQGRLECLNLSLGFPRAVETDYAVNAFWLTDSGLYYRNDEHGLLRFIPHGSAIEQMIYQSKEAAAEDVVAVEGERIAFLAKKQDGQSALISSDPAEKQLKEHLTLSFSQLNVADGYVITVEDGSHIYAVDIDTDKVYDWGAVEEHHYPQVLRDCVVLYKGNQPVFQYYPKQ